MPWQTSLAISPLSSLLSLSSLFFLLSSFPPFLALGALCITEMGGLCSKDNVKRNPKKSKEPKGEEAKEIHRAGAATNTDASDTTEKYLNGDAGARPKAVSDDALVSWPAKDGSEYDELSTLPADAVQDANEDSMNSRKDLFPQGHDAAFNMRVGTEKYSQLVVETPSEDGGAHAGPADRSPHGRVGEGTGNHRYAPIRFYDEASSTAEQNSDAFGTPREFLTESSLPLSSDAALYGQRALPETHEPYPVPLQAPPPPPPPPPQEDPGEPFARHLSGLSASSFTVTTVRNNQRHVHTPVASPSLHNTKAWKGAPEPYAASDAVFYSCRSDAAIVVPAGSAAYNSPTALALAPGLPKGKGKGQLTTGRNPPRAPRAAASPADSAFQSCRSMDSLSSSSMAALRFPLRKNGAGGRTPPRTPSGKKAVAARRGAAAAGVKPGKPPIGETPLASDSKVLRAMPESLPLPRPRARAVSVPSPTESRASTAGTAATRNGGKSIPLAPQRQTRDDGGGVADSEAFSAAPPPSSAFFSLPPTPSALGGSSPPYYGVMPGDTFLLTPLGDRVDLDSAAFQSPVSTVSTAAAVGAARGPTRMRSPDADAMRGSAAPAVSTTTTAAAGGAVRGKEAATSDEDKSSGGDRYLSDPMYSDRSPKGENGASQEAPEYPLEHGQGRASSFLRPTGPTQVYHDADDVAAPTNSAAEWGPANAPPAAAAAATGSKDDDGDSPSGGARSGSGGAARGLPSRRRGLLLSRSRSGSSESTPPSFAAPAASQGAEVVPSSSHDSSAPEKPREEEVVTQLPVAAGDGGASAEVQLMQMAADVHEIDGNEPLYHALASSSSSSSSGSFPEEGEN